MKIRKLPPVEYLNECFLYESATGRLFWKARPREHFVSTRAWNSWNKRLAGKEAFHAGRYRAGNLDGKYIVAHRVIYKLVTGEEPPPLLDHRDRNKHNNRWINIRPATKPQNSANRDLNTPSGFPGVHKHRNKNRWVAQAGHVRGRQRYVGIFDSPEKAFEARQRAMKELYGEYAP